MENDTTQNTQNNGAYLVTGVITALDLMEKWLLTYSPNKELQDELYNLSLNFIDMALDRNKPEYIDSNNDLAISYENLKDEVTKIKKNTIFNY
jgi:hypothetical protein